VSKISRSTSRVLLFNIVTSAACFASSVGNREDIYPNIIEAKNALLSQIPMLVLMLFNDFMTIGSANRNGTSLIASKA